MTVSNTQIGFSEQELDPPWRQGSFLPVTAFESLGLSANAGDNTLAVVLTHDCDCVRDEQQEPLLELIFASTTEAVDPNLTNAKSLRTLHLRVTRDGKEEAISFQANARAFIRKRDLAAFCPDPSYIMHAEERLTLVRWFASRFTRTALPDELVRRLEPMKKHLEKVGKESPYAILGIYIDFDPKGEIYEITEPYEVSVAIVYSTLERDSSSVAQTAAAKLKAQFDKLYKTLETPEAGIQWKEIEVRQCEAVADTIFSLRSALEYKLYHLDYLSLRQRPIGELPE